MKTTPTLSEYRRAQSTREQRSTLSVFTTWEMSLEQLLASIEDPDDIRDFLQLLASFHPKEIDETLLSTYSVKGDREIETPASYFVKDGVWDHEQFETLVIWMKTLSLIQFTRLANDGISLTFHPLVAEWLGLRGGRLGADHVTKLSVLHVAFYADTFSDLGSTSFPLRQQLLAHLDHVQPQMNLGVLQHRNLCLWQIARLYVDLGRLVEGEQLYKMVLAGYERAFGPEHTSTLNTVNHLGTLYKNLGRHDEAEMMYKRALAGKERALGPEHTSTLQTVNNLGVLYVNMDRLGEAEMMHNRALAGKEKAIGWEHTSMLHTLNNLGFLYTALGRLEEAEMMYNRALAGREKALGLEHTLTLQTVNNLGNLYADLGRLEEAKKMYDRAIVGYTKALGSEHTSTLTVVNNIRKLHAKLDVELL
jgi:hypothetical protein